MTEAQEGARLVVRARPAGVVARERFAGHARRVAPDREIGWRAYGVVVAFTLAFIAVTAAPAGARVVVQIADSAPVYAAPDGQLLTRGGDQIYETGRAWVLRRRDGWLAVPSAQLPAGRLAWIRQTPARRLLATRTLVRVDVSERRVWVTRGDELLLTVRIAVGAPASASPIAPTSIDEIIRVQPGSIYPTRDYGPVIVALRLAQALPSPGFPNGGIVAFHGGDEPDVGSASSGGCFRMHNADVLRFARLVRGGTPVKITG